MVHNGRSKRNERNQKQQHTHFMMENGLEKWYGEINQNNDKCVVKSRENPNESRTRTKVTVEKGNNGAHTRK